jgi:hypothetical protein
MEEEIIHPDTPDYPEAPADSGLPIPEVAEAPTADATQSLTTSDTLESGATITQAAPPVEAAAPASGVVVSSPKAFEGGEMVQLEAEVKLMINGIAHRIQSGVSWVEAHVAAALRNIGKLKE